MNAHRLALSSGGTYMNTAIPSKSDPKDSDTGDFFAENQLSVHAPHERSRLLIHSDNVEFLHLNTKASDVKFKVKPVAFDKIVLKAGQSFGPGMMCHHDEIDGVPELTCFEKPVVFVTSEGVFATDENKIATAITNVAGHEPRINAMHTVRSCRSHPYPKAHVVERTEMQLPHGADVHKAAMEADKAFPLSASHPFGTTMPPAPPTMLAPTGPHQTMHLTPTPTGASPVSSRYNDPLPTDMPPPPPPDGPNAPDGLHTPGEPRPHYPTTSPPQTLPPHLGDVPPPHQPTPPQAHVTPPPDKP